MSVCVCLHTSTKTFIQSLESPCHIVTTPSCLCVSVSLVSPVKILLCSRQNSCSMRTAGPDSVLPVRYLFVTQFYQKIHKFSLCMSYFDPPFHSFLSCFSVRVCTLSSCSKSSPPLCCRYLSGQFRCSLRGHVEIKVRFRQCA